MIYLNIVIYACERDAEISRKAKKICIGEKNSKENNRIY